MKSDQADDLNCAFAAHKAGQHNLAFDLYRRLADQGHLESQVFVAWMLSRGVGCDKNEALAATYYERAAALGSPVGCFYYGRWLTKAGEHSAAYNYYSHGARSKHFPSMFRVGLSLARGKGVSADSRRAYKMLCEVAAHGHAYALREIAIQDMLGNRGVLWIPIGVIEFFCAFCWGVIISIVNKDSDLIRG
jgi:uncharacterized protein